MNATIIWQGEMPVPKSPNKQVATYRLVHIKDKDFVCERSNRDAVGGMSWWLDKDALVPAMCCALAERVAMCSRWAERLDAESKVTLSLQREVTELRAAK